MKSKVDVKKAFDLIKSKHDSGIMLLYKNGFSLMYGIAFSISKNEELSKDAVQNTVVQIWALEPEKLPKSSEATWLYSVTKNETLALLRKEKSVENIDDFLSIVDFGKTMLDEFIDKDSYYSLIKGLDEKQKEIVTLKVLGGFTHKEISKILGEPIGTIQWRYNSAIKKLKIALGSFFVLTFTSLTAYVGRFIYLFNQNSAKRPGEIGGLGQEVPKLSLQSDLLFLVAGSVFFISLSLLIILFIYFRRYQQKQQADTSK